MISMDNEPDIIKQLRKEEETGKLYCSESVIINNPPTKDNIKKFRKENNKDFFNKDIDNKDNDMDIDINQKNIKLLKIIENSIDFIAEIKEDGEILYANPAMAKSLNTTVGNLIGKNIKKFLSLGKVEERNQIVKKVIETGEKIEVNDERDGRYFNNIIIPSQTLNGQKSLIIIAREITQYKKIENELKNSSKHFKKLFDCVADPIVIIDSKGKLLEINKKLIETTGYKKEDFIGKNIFKINILSKKTKAVILKNLIKRMSGMNVKPYDIELILHNGEKKRFEINATKIDYNGSPADLVVFRDIEERSKEKELMEKSKKQIEHILNAAAGGIILIDKDYRIIAMNNTMAEMLEVDIEKSIGLKCYEIFKSELCTTDYCPLKKILKEGVEIQYEHIMETKNGKKIPCIVKLTPYKDNQGNLIGIIKDYRDITMVKKTKEHLKDREELFRTISSSAQDGIIMIDNNGNVDYWNEAAEKIFGYKPEEIIGQEMHIILAPSEYHQAYRQAFEKFKNTGKGKVVGKTLELKAKRKDGEEFPIELSMSSVKIKGKWNAVGIVRDITNRKNAEKQLKEKVDQLEKYKKLTVGRELKMIELKKQIQDLESKMEGNKSK